MNREFDLIDWIRSQQSARRPVLVPASDDLAVLENPGDEQMLLGVDQVLDGVHFDSSRHSPWEIGQKVMNRNLSDCAAMACLPVAALVSWALPRGTDPDYVKQLYTGMKQAAEVFGCQIIGGDTGVWDQKLAVTVTILGRSGGVTPVCRSGARVGDTIYVTGPLGGSILGRHLRFVPRIHHARHLATKYKLHAMIDISDGLSRDLAHICRESKVGVVLEAPLIPIHDDARQLPGDPLMHALHDGEDHELCLAAPDGIQEAIRIGTVVEGSGVWLKQNGRCHPLEKGGFEHVF